MGNSVTYLKEMSASPPSSVNVVTDPRSPSGEFTRTPIEVIIILVCYYREIMSNRTLMEQLQNTNILAIFYTEIYVD